jgi:integrase/recombinase XerD
MAEIVVKFRKYYSSKDGTCPVYFVVRTSGKRVWLNTGVTITPDRWDEERHCVKKQKDASDLNLVIEKRRAVIDEILIRYRLQRKKITPDQLKKEYENPGVYYDFIKYSRDYIKQKKGIAQPATIASLDSIINKLEEYRAKIEFRHIDENFINEYRKYLKKDLKNNPNTINKSMVWIKAILNQAISDKIIDENPFNKIKLSKSQPDRMHLTKDELLKLWEYYKKNLLQNNLHLVCRYYLFSCFTGLRLSDVKRITLNDIISDSIFLRPLKSQNTTNEIVQIPLTSFARTLISDSGAKLKQPIFIAFSDQATNRYLKDLIGGCGINKKLSFHSARHTFATIFLELNPGDVATLQKILGHSSIEHTMVYVHIDDTIKRDRMDKFEQLK